ncbi:MAG: hypothetical protein HQL66_11170 [Magnetococcales bacterium]|nr:hypothetical protein [Magnetococcales bacterium]
MTHHSITTTGGAHAPGLSDLTPPIIEYFLEGEPIGVAIPRPGTGTPRARDADDCLPCLEKRWCLPVDGLWQ